MGIPKKSARQFRIIHACFALIFGGVAVWLFATSRPRFVAWVFAIAAAFATFDAIVGWRKSRD
jgi:hypothetical protein